MVSDSGCLFDVSLVNADGSVIIPPIKPDSILSRFIEDSGFAEEKALDYLAHNSVSLWYDHHRELPVQWIPPHTADRRFGAVKSDVMAVLPYWLPSEYESGALQSVRPLALWGPALYRFGIDVNSVMLASPCPMTLPEHVKKPKESLLASLRPVLAYIYNIVRPKHVLLFGAASYKEFMSLFDAKAAKKAKFKNLRGKVLDFPSGVKAVVSHAPHAVLRNPDVGKELEKDVTLFASITAKGCRPEGVQGPVCIDILRSAEDVDRAINELESNNLYELAVDLEWGYYFDSSGKKITFLRTAQVTGDGKTAYVVHITHAGGLPAFDGGHAAGLDAIRKLLDRPGVTLIGHNFRGDIKVLRRLGVDVMHRFVPGGFDTMLAAHLLREEGDLQLELLAFYYLGLDRYDSDVRHWLSQNYSDKAIDDVGYGTIPDDILIPYAALDAVATFRLKQHLHKELCECPSVRKLYAEIVHPVNLPLLEMEETGLMIDTELLHTLSKIFNIRKQQLADDVRRLLNGRAEDDPTGEGFELNLESPDQIIGALFGWKKRSKSGEYVSPLPDHIKILNLTPIKATVDDLPWSEVVESGKEHLYRPSSGADALGILTGSHPELEPLRQYRVCSQAVKNFVGTVVDVVDDKPVYFRGIGEKMDPDNRLRVDFRQTLETGRYATSPNVQNLPSKQEKELSKLFKYDAYVILGAVGNKILYWSDEELEWTDELLYATKYKTQVDLLESKVYKSGAAAAVDTLDIEYIGSDPRHTPIRSIIRATPGTVFIDSDWQQAELFTMGHLAGDDVMLHTLATSDIHSEVTIDAFGDTIKIDGKYLREYTPKEFKALCGKNPVAKAYRTGGKAVVFGIPYGRGAAAIALQLKTEGVEITVEECGMIISGFKSRFADVANFLEECNARVDDPGYVETKWGRRRRFEPTTDKAIRAAQGREAVNFPIQGTVADAMSCALINFYAYRLARRNVQYRIVLSVHDAVVLEVPYEHVRQVVEEVVPECMHDRVQVPGTDLRYIPDKPDVCLKLSQKLNEEELEELGFNPETLEYRKTGQTNGVLV